jgi:hypothetical protein
MQFVDTKEIWMVDMEHSSEGKVCILDGIPNPP